MLCRLILPVLVLILLSFVQSAIADSTADTFTQLAKRIEAVPLLYVIPPSVKAEEDSINRELGKFSPAQWVEITKKLPAQGMKTRAFVLDNIAANKRAETIPLLEKQYDDETDPYTRDHIFKVVALIDFENQTNFLIHVLHDSSPVARGAVLDFLMGKKLKPELLKIAVGILNNDPSPRVRGRAAFTVSKSGEADAREVLENH